MNAKQRRKARKIAKLKSFLPPPVVINFTEIHKGSIVEAIDKWIGFVKKRDVTVEPSIYPVSIGDAVSCDPIITCDMSFEFNIPNGNT